MIDEQSFIDFTCPKCGEPVSFPQSEAGCLRECPSCLESLVVPTVGGSTGCHVPLPVATNRLTLRRFQPNDWKPLMELMPEATEDWVLNWLERERQVRLTTPEQVFYLGIELNEGEQLIGYVTLKFTDAERAQGLVGLHLMEKYPSEDFGAEALDALLGFCFEGIHMHRVQATCTSADTGLCQLFEAVGLRREAEFVKDTRLPEGGWANSVWFAALEEDYEKSGEK
jgi:[ribosomal protein S5]-alanine N-acetyltransferase